MSYRLTGEIGIKGMPSVKMAAMIAPSEMYPSSIGAAILLNDRFGKVYNNALEQPVVTGVKLRLESLPQRRTATVESARISRTEARPGDTVEVEATVHPYQSAADQMCLPATFLTD